MGEVETSDYLKRAYPTIDDLLGGQAEGLGFAAWTVRLYQPLYDAAFDTEENPG